MPEGLDGAQATSRIIRELDIPLIIIADRADDGLIAKAKDVGAGGFLLKPVNPGQLKAAVEIALDKKGGENATGYLLSDLIENTNDLVYVIDGKGNIRYVNNRVSEKLGYTSVDIVGKTFKDFVTPRSFENAAEIFRRQLAGEDVGAFEIELVDRQGNTRTIETREQLKFDNGRIVEVRGIGRDITVRKHAEEALRESEERYRSLFEDNPDPVYTLDLSGTVLSVNKPTCVISGYPKEEFLSRPFDFLLAPDRSKETREHFLRAAEGQIQRYKSAVIAKDGRRIELDVTNTPIIVSGKIVGVYGIAQDITEKRKIEAALRESEQKFRSMVENINDAVINLDTDGTILYISPSVYAMFGYHPEEVIGGNFAKFIHPDDLPGVIGSFERSLGGIKEEWEFRVITKDGAHRYIRSLSSVVMRDGSVVGLTGVLTDIDRRKKAEAALKESEKKFRSLFDTSRDVVYISTVEGSFIDINTAAEQTFGYTHNELLEINAKDLYKDPGQRERFKHVVNRDGFVKDHEVQMKKKDGTIVDCLITSTVRRDPEGAVIGYQGIIRDTTERVRLRRRLIQAEKLSSLGAMISGVAHEINNPLTSIIGNAQLLMKKEIPADFRSKLEVINRESIRCTKIIAGLLSFARERRPERRMIDINAVVAESLQLRDYDMAVNNVRVDVNLAGDLPRTSADPFQLQQVFINLINNSHDALKEKGGGTLSIRSFARGNAVHVEFADDGPGIAPGDLTRVFDPFFTTKDVGKGTGLGLSIAYGIINEHGGTIDVESPPGSGAKFEVVIPLVKIPPAEQ